MSNPSEDTSSVYKESLPAHIWRNGICVEEKFDSYLVCDRTNLIYKDPESKENPLFACDVDRYYLCSPHLYRCLPSDPDCIVDKMGVQQVFQELSQIKSLLPMNVFEDKFPKICNSFSKFFTRRTHHPQFLCVTGEEDLRCRITCFLQHIATTVGGGDNLLPVCVEDVTGAGGVLCKLKNPPEQTPIPETGVVFPPALDLNAGVLTSLDLMIKYGHPDYKGQTFFVADLKRIRSTHLDIKDADGNEIREEDSPDEPPPYASPYWYRNGEPLLAQLDVGLFGEGARLGMAILPEGWRAVLLRDVPVAAAGTLEGQSRKCRLGCQPKAGSLGD